MTKILRPFFLFASCLLPLAACLLPLAGCGHDVKESGPPVGSCETTHTLQVSTDSPGPNNRIFGSCMDISPPIDKDGQAACLVLDLLPPGSTCHCDASRGRAPVSAAHQAAVPAGTGCACEVLQITGIDEETCQYDETDNPVTAGDTPLNGWCFIDGTRNPPIGNLKLTAPCPLSEKRIIRLVGQPSDLEPARTIMMICESAPDAGCSG